MLAIRGPGYSTASVAVITGCTCLQHLMYFGCEVGKLHATDTSAPSRLTTIYPTYESQPLTLAECILLAILQPLCMSPGSLHLCRLLRTPWDTKAHRVPALLR